MCGDATTVAVIARRGFHAEIWAGMHPVKCPICNAPAMSSENPRNRVLSVECPRCATYRADHYALLALKGSEWSVEQIGRASGYLLRNAGMFLDAEGVV